MGGAAEAVAAAIRRRHGCSLMVSAPILRRLGWGPRASAAAVGVLDEGMRAPPGAGVVTTELLDSGERAPRRLSRGVDSGDQVFGRVSKPRLAPPRFSHTVRLGASAIRRFGSRHRDQLRLHRDFPVAPRESRVTGRDLS